MLFTLTAMIALKLFLGPRQQCSRSKIMKLWSYILICIYIFFFFLQIREKHLLDKAYVEYPDFPLVVTGHSLGAGTAVILSFMLRLKYNSVKCFAFGPPGGLLNSQAYAISTTFVTSVVVGDDIICRYVYEAFLAISWRLCHVMLCRVVSCRAGAYLGLLNCGCWQ